MLNHFFGRNVLSLCVVAGTTLSIGTSVSVAQESPFPFVGGSDAQITSDRTFDTDSDAEGMVMTAGGGVDQFGDPVPALEYMVYSFGDLYVAPDVTVTIIGTRPPIFMATGTMTIEGRFDLSGSSGEVGQNGGKLTDDGRMKGAGGAGGAAGAGAIAFLCLSDFNLTSTGVLEARGGDSRPGGLPPPFECLGDPVCFEDRGYIAGDGGGGRGGRGRAGGEDGGDGGASVAGGGGGAGGGGLNNFWHNGNGGGGGGGGGYGGPAGGGGGGKSSGLSGSNAAPGQCPTPGNGGAGGNGGGNGGGTGGTAGGQAGAPGTNRRGGGGGGGGGNTNGQNGGNGGSGASACGGGGGAGGGADSCNPNISAGVGGAGGPGGGAAGAGGTQGQYIGGSSGNGGAGWIFIFCTDGRDITIDGLIDLSGGDGGDGPVGGSGLLTLLATSDYQGSGTIFGTVERDADGLSNSEFFAAGGGGGAGGGGQGEGDVSCYADFNGDGAIDTRDFLVYLNVWSSGDAQADCNADGVLNTLDFLCFLNAWSDGCS